MSKSKQISQSSKQFAAGGPSGKVGNQTKTGTQKPGQSASMGRNGTPAKGGPSGKIGNQMPSRPAKVK